MTNWPIYLRTNLKWVKYRLNSLKLINKIINWVNSNYIYVTQIDPKTVYLLNGLYKSTWIWLKFAYTWSKPVKKHLKFKLY